MSDGEQFAFLRVIAVVAALAVLAGGIAGLGYWRESSTGKRHAAERYECERDVRSMRGGDASDLQSCLTAKGWDSNEAIKEANLYWVTTH